MTTFNDEMIVTKGPRPRVDVQDSPAMLEAVRDVLLAGLPQIHLDPFAPATDRKHAISVLLRGAQTQNTPLPALPNDHDALYALYTKTIGWGPAQRYLDDPAINEVKIIGTRVRVHQSGLGWITVPDQFDSVDDVVNRVKMLASTLQPAVLLDGDHPQQTLPVAAGTRMHATIYPAVLENDVLVCIRRGRAYGWRLDDLVAKRSLDADTAELLHLLVAARCSFLISGRTEAGKTTVGEALCNSWAGRPHVLTVEDSVMEITVQPQFDWTRELVDTTLDKDAFSIRAREALHQTPDIMYPGETRAKEAGAVLSLATSGCPVITTIHASSSADAVKRFARCASLPGAYFYEDRFHDALDDAASSFSVLIEVDDWADSGRRVITNISLSTGVDWSGNRAKVMTIPLVDLDVNERGEIGWRAYAQATHNGLEWLDGANETPAWLQRRLLRARAARFHLTITPTICALDTALAQARELIAAKEPQRALDTLRRAWNERHDVRVLSAVQQTLRYLPKQQTDALAQGRQTHQALEAAIAVRRWDEAECLLRSLLGDVVLAAVLRPSVGNFEQYERQLEAAQNAKRRAVEARSGARQALDANTPHLALSQLDVVDSRLLDDRTSLELQDVRVDALRLSVAQGQVQPQVLELAEARRNNLRMLVESRNGGAA